MGSGSTIVAAIKEKRKYIGIEKDEHYFNVAKQRIDNELRQLSLFHLFP
jgi:site-specific DNA-methyltransferase (adenine-specific)